MLNQDLFPETSGNQILGGLNPVLTQLTVAPSQVVKVLLADNRTRDKRSQKVFELARQVGCPVQTVPWQNLEERFEPGFRHQGVAAYVLETPPKSLDDLKDELKLMISTGQTPCILALDDITDPHNIGAILRVADAGGVTAVLLPKRGSNLASPVVSKTSAGASQTVDCVLVPNLVQALRELKEVGCWVVGAVCDDKAQPYRSLDWKMPTVILVGNEGDGLSAHLVKQCDFTATIPMRGRVDSLNVSCATALLVYEWLASQT